MPQGQLSNYATELGVAECTRLLQERLAMGPNGYTEDEETGCWLWVGRVLPEGYAQIKRKTPAQRAAGGGDRNSGKNFMFHRIAYTANHGHDIQFTGSHLCSRPRCFNPDHIVDESIELNNQRKGCVGRIICQEHDHLIVDLCDHTPKCVKPNPPHIVCCLSIRDAEAELPPPLSPIQILSSPPSIPRPTPRPTYHLESSSPVRLLRRPRQPRPVLAALEDSQILTTEATLRLHSSQLECKEVPDSADDGDDMDTDQDMDSPS